MKRGPGAAGRGARCAAATDDFLRLRVAVARFTKRLADLVACESCFLGLAERLGLRLHAHLLRLPLQFLGGLGACARRREGERDKDGKEGGEGAGQAPGAGGMRGVCDALLRSRLRPWCCNSGQASRGGRKRRNLRKASGLLPREETPVKTNRLNFGRSGAGPAGPRSPHRRGQRKEAPGWNPAPLETFLRLSAALATTTCSSATASSPDSPTNCRSQPERH